MSKIYADLTRENNRMRAALSRISNWELPQSGRFWKNEDGADDLERPMT